MTTQVAARQRVEFKSQFSILKCCLTDLCFSHCCHFSECDSVQPKSSCYFGHRTQMYINSCQPNDCFYSLPIVFFFYLYITCVNRELQIGRRGRLLEEDISPPKWRWFARALYFVLQKSLSRSCPRLRVGGSIDTYMCLPISPRERSENSLTGSETFALCKSK